MPIATIISDKNASGITWTGTGADTTLLPSMTYEVRIDTSNQATFIKLALTAANSFSLFT